MRHLLLRLFLTLAATLFFPALASAAPKSGAELDAQLAAELSVIDATAAALFVEASRAQEFEPERAARLYGEVVARAPGFAAAKRRRCGALVTLGRSLEGIRLCREAAAQEPSSTNLAALAVVLAASAPKGEALTADQLAEIETTLQRAEAADPEDPYPGVARCQVLMASARLADAEKCIERVAPKCPKADAGALWVALAVLHADGNVRDARSRAAAQRAIAAARWADPEGTATELAACEVAVRAGDFPALKTCSAAFVERAPRDPRGHVFAAIASASAGDSDAAHASVRRARELGLPNQRADDLDRALDRARPLHLRWGPTVAVVVAAWVGAFAMLLLAGGWLSRSVLAHAARAPRDGTPTATPGELRLRATYAAVLWTCCAFYYLSLPLVAAVVALGGAAIVLGSLALGHVPVKLLMIVVAVVAVTLWSMVKSFFVRNRDADPGERLDLGEHPRLAATLQEVADKVGTRPVDAVFLTPGTDVAVFERGGLGSQLRGRSERCLVLGAAVLDGMDLTALKAILAHEYGHFGNRDTAGGGLALGVRRSLLRMALGLAQGGAAAWYNPAWLFLLGFQRVFLRISQGASRLQEVLADRWSAVTYGAAALERGLRHVVARTVRFDAHAAATLDEVVAGLRPLRNLYRYTPATPADEGALASAIEAEMSREPSPYDSHPAPNERFALVRGIAEPDLGGSSGGMAWDLFARREELELGMTLLVRTRLLESHGVVLPETLAEGQAEGGA